MSSWAPVLDLGHCEKIQCWGNDELIVRAARQSTDGAFRGWDKSQCVECKDEYLSALFESGEDCPSCGESSPPTYIKGDDRFLKYLWCKKHSTPFEHCGATFEVKAPIFVFREWHRHRTQSYSEMSARYIPLPDENWHPTVKRIVKGAALAGSNKQARGAVDKLPTEDEAEFWLKEQEAAYRYCRKTYELGLSFGIQKEICRSVLNHGQYSQMWASANLLNWLRFLTLRQAGDAQQEIRDYADVVHNMLAQSFPRTLEIFSTCS